jgi:hypothetical protein
MREEKAVVFQPTLSLLPRLKRLEMPGCYCLTDELLDLLLEASPETLTDLNLDGCISLTSHGIHSIKHSFLGRDLESINLSHCFRVSASSITSLFRECGANLRRVIMRHMAFDEFETKDADFSKILLALATSQSSKRALTLLDLGVNFNIAYGVLKENVFDVIGEGEQEWTLGLKGCSLLLGNEIELMKKRGNGLLTIEYDPFLLWDNTDESIHILLADYMNAETVVM